MITRKYYSSYFISSVSSYPFKNYLGKIASFVCFVIVSYFNSSVIRYIGSVKKMGLSLFYWNNLFIRFDFITIITDFVASSVTTELEQLIIAACYLVKFFTRD